MATVELNRFNELQAFAEQIRSFADNPSQIDPASEKRLQQHVDRLGEHSIGPLLRLFQQLSTRICCRNLLAYAGQNPLLNQRIVTGLRRLITVKVGVSPLGENELQIAALALLHQVSAGVESVQATFADPQQVLRQAARSFASQIDSPAEIARAAQLMMTQLPGAEMISMLELMLEELPAAAQQLCEEFGARLDLDLSIRTQIRSLSACHPVTFSVRDPSVVSACETAPLCWQILLSAQASAAITIMVSSPPQARYAQYQIDDRNVLIETSYQQGKVLSVAPDRLLQRESVSFARAREIVAGAARNAVRLGTGPTDNYYLSRDLLMLEQLHRSCASPHGNHAYIANHATDLLACGESQRAHDILRQYVLQHPTATSNPDLALAYGMSCLATQQFTIAQTMLSQACQHRDATVDHWWNLACAAERNQDIATMETALTCYLSAAQNAPMLSSQSAHRIELARALLGGSASLPPCENPQKKNSKRSRKRTGPSLRA
jgi:hypothetical protein